MRGINSAITTYILSLPLLVLGVPPSPSNGPANPPGRERGMSLPRSVAAVTGSTNTISVAVIPVSTLMSQTYSPIPSVEIKTIVESSLMTSASSASRATAAATSTLATSSASLGNPSQPMSSSSATSSYITQSSHNRNLVIILSSVLGFLGLLLVAGLAVLVFRYRRGQTPFGHRGASPIDDEEIASWRRSEQEKRLPSPLSEHRAAIREVPELPLAHHSGWTWATTASSGSIHTIPSPFPDSPQYIATAPNARAGLTDETVPGEDPFITPPKRHNSRLSKLPPSHSRNRSGRSSISAKSMLGAQSHHRTSSDLKARDRTPAWYDNYDDSVHGAYLKEIGGIDSPRMSKDMFDDLTSGGLSPRPKSVVRTMTWERTDDIGRAIA
jgi:hypothetical protein